MDASSGEKANSGFLAGNIKFFYGSKLPAILDANDLAISINDLLRLHYDELQYLKHRFGAVLLRGFPMVTAGDFSEFINQYFRGEMPFSYIGGAAARRKIDSRVSEATTLAAHVMLPMHNEMAYQSKYPRELVFFCEKAAEKGGQTPLCDMRRVLQSMEAEDVQKLEQLQVIYHRYFPQQVQATHSPMMKSWGDTFQTDDRAEVEKMCAWTGETISWDSNGGLYLRATLDVVKQHPATGEKLIFASGLRTNGELATWQQQMREPTDPSFAPLYLQLGDGSAIPSRATEMFMTQREALTEKFDWQEGDLLMVDNLLCSHGRMPYEGSRSILVAMR